MKKKLVKIARSFKSKILLSFFAFIRIFIVWICVYFFFNNKQSNLNLFINHLTQLQNQYSESNRHLKNFILVGFHEPAFHTTGNQKDIKLFFSEQESVIENLDQVKEDAIANHVGINDELETLTKLHKSLVDTVKLLKQLYLMKGFSDFGTESTVRKFALYIEDSSQVPKIDILMLRRHEKDYMLRDDKRQVSEFNVIADRLIKRFSNSTDVLNALINYKQAFNDYANYSERLSINTDHGMYAHAQDIINQLDEEYSFINAKVVKEAANLNNLFKIILISTFIILLLASVYLSIVLSNNLTRDIKKLNKNVAGFVRSEFKDGDGDIEEPLTSKITEIQELNDDIMSLKTALKLTLSNLKNSINEEKKTSADLELSNTKLREQLHETEKLKHQVENSEAILNAFFQSSSSCHILIGRELEIIAFNKAASAFIHKLNNDEITLGVQIFDYFDESQVYKFIANYQKALLGRYIHEEQLFNYKSSKSELWDISFVPVSDKEGNIFAVSFNATNITDSKG